MADAEDGGGHDTLPTLRRREQQGPSVQEEWNDLLLSRAKLKQSSNTSALLSGFAMVAMVETEIGGVEIPLSLAIAFSVVTTLLVATHLFALMISTCILPRIATTMAHKPTPETLRNSPHRHVQRYIEMSWIFSTWIGIILFLVDVVLIAWIKFSGPKKDLRMVEGLIVPPLARLPATTVATESAVSAMVAPMAAPSSKNSAAGFAVDLTISNKEEVDGHDLQGAAIAATAVLACFMVAFLAFAYQFYQYMIKHKFDVAKYNIEDMRDVLAKLRAEENLERRPEADTYSRLSDWQAATPGVISQGSASRFTFSGPLSPLDRDDLQHGVSPGARVIAASAGSAMSYNNPYQQHESTVVFSSRQLQSSSTTQPYGQQRQPVGAVYLGTAGSPNVLLPPPLRHGPQQLPVLPLDRSPLVAGRHHAPSAASTTGASGGQVSGGMRSVCIREGADVNSQNNSDTNSHSSHPHMFVSTMEYNAICAGAAGRPANPTHWEGADAASHHSALVSPHAPLHYTVPPPPLDSQISELSLNAVEVPDGGSNDDDDEALSNTSDASFLTANGVTSLSSVGAELDKKAQVDRWLQNQGKRRSSQKGSKQSLQQKPHHTAARLDSIESAM